MRKTESTSKLVALSPFEHPDTALAVAAARAGALSILDLGRHAGRARKAIQHVALEWHGPFGVRLPDHEIVHARWVPDQVTHVVLPNADGVGQWSDRIVCVEVRSRAEAKIAIEAGADRLIAKGSEAGGLVGNDAAFILLQQLLSEHADQGVWVQGGMGIHTGAASVIAGAEAVVMDSQLALLAEAETATDIQQSVRAMDGSETKVVFGHRVYARPDLVQCETIDELLARLGALDLRRSTVPCGQDAALAKLMAERYRTVSGVVNALEDAIIHAPHWMSEAKPLAGGSSMALDHGCRFPVLQGPMTRVSDQAAFASAVAQGGGLPFLALALMRGPKVRRLITETAQLMGNMPWGVGILGFVPPSLREEQLAVLNEVRPPFAIIAGGRPAQARELEERGTTTYLHVPSPGLLDLFIKEGARRFIFEGRECGGHVGPRSSFVLWEQQIARLMKMDCLTEVSAVFAGGIHDARSAAMIATMAAPLIERGARVGVLMGTAYLFTKEAVGSGAILPAYQSAAINARETTLLETAPGHATRCLRTEYVETFERERERLQAEGLSAQEVWAALEQLNVGRLRVASKGLTRDETGQIVTVESADQKRDGMYMVGQVITLRHEDTSIRSLHEDVCDGSTQFLRDYCENHPLPIHEARTENPPADVAIIGMSCVFPNASNKDEFWANLVAGKNSITEVPHDRWDPAIYYDPEAQNGEKTPSKWGGFLDAVPFDPLEYGIPPNSLNSIEPVQLLSLQVARDALADAGYGERTFNRERTSVIFGAEAGTELAGAYGFRAVFPQLIGDLSDALDERLPQLTEDSFPGVLANVIAGRIANRLDLGGVNYTVDAACASSLAAVDLALKELKNGTSDMVLCGGADLHNSINDYLLFSSVHALSRKGQCQSFDHEADGIVLGEGVAVVVLKRLADAQRDGDRVYAVIKGLGGSSDGRHLGLTAPRSDGQVRALERAYAAAQIAPARIGLLEAHGTGTVVGDRTELETMERVFNASGALVGQTALGSAKTNIGHTKCAAGMAGLIKSALSIHHRVRPATLNIEQPNPAYDVASSPFSLSAYSRPWSDQERCAGISAFGFGGTNFHAILSSEGADLARVQSVRSAELFLFRGETGDAAQHTLSRLQTFLEQSNPCRLSDLAYSLDQDGGDQPVQLAIVASDHQELAERIQRAIDSKESGAGVFRPTGVTGDVAFVYPGQGSQSPGMMASLFTTFPQLQHYLQLGRDWLDILYPPTPFTPEGRTAQKEKITDTRNAQPTLGIVDLATAAWLEDMGVEAKVHAGHSYGELVALSRAGAIDEADLLNLSRARGEAILNAAGQDPGTMAAVSADAETTAGALGDFPEVVLANLNGPKQTVISGPTPSINNAITHLKSAGVAARRIPVACAFHSPVVADAKDNLRAYLETIEVTSPRDTVWSNTTASPYPEDPNDIRELLAEHVVSPVHFVTQINRMYDAGSRIFVEVGPGRVMSGLIGRILGDRQHLVVPCSSNGRGETADLLTALAQLVVHGVNIRTDALYRGRSVAQISLSQSTQYSATTWMVNGYQTWPAHQNRPEAKAPLGLGEATQMTHQTATTSAGSERASVVLEYLTNMRQMVSDQRDVMLGYLGAEPAPRVLHSTPASAPVIDAQVVEESPMAVQEVQVVEESVEDILVSLVSERTGYPPEMLALDLDLEAALSIDSIKRIEILGALGEALGLSGSEGGAIESLVEELAAVKTLQGILDFLARQEASETEAPIQRMPIDPDATVPYQADPLALPDRIPLTRHVFRVETAPTLVLNGRQVRGKTFGMTADSHGVAQAFKALLEDNGARVDILTLETEEWGYDGVLHLATLDSDPRLTQLPHVFDSVRDGLLKGAFWILGATGLGGGFGRPVQGTHAIGTGLSGLFKSAAVEWPESRIRVVDLNLEEDPQSLAMHLYQEMLANDGLVEVGYRNQERRILKPIEATLDALTEEGSTILDDRSVILVTGGAKGITAQAAIALAQQAGGHFELVGRTPLEPLEDDPELAAATDAVALRRILIARQKSPDIAAVERGCRRILGLRVIHDTLARLRDSGATVRYHAIDVRDEDAFGALIDDLYAEHGQIHGVIHGAGIIEDKLLRDKTGDSFYRVYETKARPAHILAERLKDDVRFIAFFSSVAGSFGNRGQSDYAAANDALDKLAISLNETISGRVLSINWGPWSGTGMVSPELEVEYARRGIGLIDSTEGVEAFINELRFGDPDDAQVLLMCAKLNAMMGIDD